MAAAHLVDRRTLRGAITERPKVLPMEDGRLQAVLIDLCNVPICARLTYVSLSHGCFASTISSADGNPPRKSDSFFYTCSISAELHPLVTLFHSCDRVTMSITIDAMPRESGFSSTSESFAWVQALCAVRLYSGSFVYPRTATACSANAHKVDMRPWLASLCSSNVNMRLLSHTLHRTTD